MENANEFIVENSEERNSPISKIRKAFMVLAEEIGFLHLRWQFFRVIMSLFPPYTINRLRTWLCRLAGFSIGKKTIIIGTPTIVGTSNLYSRLIIGKHCKISFDCIFDLAGKIIIQDNANIGPQTTIITGSHEIGSSNNRLGGYYPADVEVGEGVLIAARVTILPGVKIGNGSVIAAGSVVNKDVPENVVVGGVPARIIKELGNE